MSAAKPVVATECAGNADLVVHGENGFLVPFGDPRAMAERVSELLGDRALARSMGLAGKRRVEERFTLDHKVRAHEALYDRLLSG
jgi:glycosyltransferase involved in cell wall biosynthesis